MKKLFGYAQLEAGRGSQLSIADKKKHHELQLIALFRGQEIRDFLIPG
jgi:hypothetical protein